MTIDMEVIVMVEPESPVAGGPRVPIRLLAVLLTTAGLTGCASVAQDVRDYYRQMEYNYKEAREKAKIDALSLEGESRILATTGDFSRYRRKQRELDRVKGWEARCAKQEERFQKAAAWTEDRFHLEKPPAPRNPSSSGAAETGASTAPSETKSPS
jgi:hypothetical protein